jgi:hypothetical protein
MLGRAPRIPPESMEMRFDDKLQLLVLVLTRGKVRQTLHVQPPSYRVVKSTAENLSPTRVRLSVEVPFEELKPSLDAAYKKIGSQIRIPGFRPGKVPARIIDQRVGRAAVLEEAVNEVVPQLIAHGRIIRPRLGIRPMQEGLLRRLGVSGVLVGTVDKESGAARAGLRETRRGEDERAVLGDIIVGLAGKKVASYDDLVSVLEKQKIGDAVPVRILRDDRELSVDVTLSASR